MLIAIGQSTPANKINSIKKPFVSLRILASYIYIEAYYAHVYGLATINDAYMRHMLAARGGL